MVKGKKSVKKYVQKHLGAALKQRKKLKPMKQAIRRQQAAFKPDKSGEEQKEEVVEKNAGSASERRDSSKKGSSEVTQHKAELSDLAQKDPEFYEFLKEHDKELLDFEDDEEESDEEQNLDLGEGEDGETDGPAAGEDEGDGQSVTLTTALVDEWCAAVKVKTNYGIVRNLLQAFRAACHYGDGEEQENLNTKYNLANSHVFNRIMVFVLVEMDGILKHMMTANAAGGKTSQDNMPKDPQKSPRWKKVEPLVKSYLGNVLHILNQMTDNEMISFTLRRLKVSVPFLVALPRLSLKFLKVALHFWGSGEGALPVIALFFVREMAMKLDSEMLDACLKGMYKEFAANAKFVNPTSFPRIQFRMNCVTELYGIDSSASYQLAFVFIRQMAFILRNAITVKTKDAFKRVYNWQYINTLHLWVRVLSTYAAQGDLQPLVYPLAQIIGGVARLVPTARYFPLRLQCVKMLNQLAGATGAFTPVAALLLDMLQFKELHMSPSAGAGKSVDFNSILKVAKTDVKTRAFQDECVSTVVEQLGEHLAQWSYAVAFPELSVVPLIQLRHFQKKTTVDRFRRQVKQLVEQVERNVVFVGKKRDAVTFSPKDSSSVQSFLQAEKEAGASPLSKYLVTLRQRAQQRSSYLHKTSEIVGDIGGTKKSRKNSRDDSDGDDDEDEDEDDEGGDGEGNGSEEDDEEKASKVFSKDWLPQKKSKEEVEQERASAKQSTARRESNPDDSDEDDGDIVEDLLMSSDDEEADDDVYASEDDSDDAAEGPRAPPSTIKKKRGPQRSQGPGDRSSKKPRRKMKTSNGTSKAKPSKPSKSKK
ncbi:nucleolar complex protein 2 [Marchantia polymorpha subsp. ruderalis]